MFQGIPGIKVSLWTINYVTHPACLFEVLTH